MICRRDKGLGLLLLLIVGACVSDEVGSGTPAGVSTVGDVPGIDNPTAIENPAATRRFTVDELQASVSIVAGSDLSGQPVQWRVGNNDAYDDAVFGRTLGRPDYVTVTEEDPAPSALYVKFAEDMARDVCDQLVTLDLGRSDPTLWPLAPVDATPSDAQLADNLAYLALRFWGFGKDEVADLLSPLKAVHAAGVAADDPSDEVPAQAEGWRAVCIAMFQDPAFHLH